jgi:hypothetical protein
MGQPGQYGQLILPALVLYHGYQTLRGDLKLKQRKGTKQSFI